MTSHVLLSDRNQNRNFRSNVQKANGWAIEINGWIQKRFTEDFRDKD
jgi:hypothetical protein